MSAELEIMKLVCRFLTSIASPMLASESGSGKLASESKVGEKL